MGQLWHPFSEGNKEGEKSSTCVSRALSCPKQDKQTPRVQIRGVEWEASGGGKLPGGQGPVKGP